jgi:hypothetical protein
VSFDIRGHCRSLVGQAIAAEKALKLPIVKEGHKLCHH